MAWWRERLEKLDEDAGAPVEPRLQAVANELLPRGVSGRDLSRLEDAWLPLLDPFPWGEAQANALKLRGRILFGIGAILLGGTAAEAEGPGALWSLVDSARHCSDPPSREQLLDEAKAARSELSNRVPRKLRPLTTLGAVAASDASQGGSAARVAAALKHRLTGRFSFLK